MEKQKRIEEAIKCSIHLEVVKAKEKGREVIRWGDVWLIKTNKKKEKFLKKYGKFQTITLFVKHEVVGWCVGTAIYIVGTSPFVHTQNLDLGGDVWRVYKARRYRR